MSYQAKLALYEQQKRYIQSLNLPPREYEKAISNLARKLGV